MQEGLGQAPASSTSCSSLSGPRERFEDQLFSPLRRVAGVENSGRTVLSGSSLWAASLSPTPRQVFLLAAQAL